MPRTTHTPSAPANTATEPHLEDVRLIHSSTRLARLQHTIYGLTNNKGQPIYNTLHKCGEYTGQERKNVSYVGYANGKIVKCGVVTCDNPECPVCGPKVAAQKTRSLNKAITQLKMEGGEMAFLTITMRPNRDQVKSIQVMKKLKSKIVKCIENHNRGLELGDRALDYITIEKTFGSKWAIVDGSKEATQPYAYLHVHLHLLLGQMPNSNRINELVRKIKKLTRAHWDREDVSADIETVSGENTNQSAGFYLKWIDTTEDIAHYVNKCITKNDQLALEMTQDHTKKGHGYGLFVLLDKLQRDPHNQLYSAHKKNIRIWFKEMFRARRTNRINVDYWEKRFVEKQKERILDWLQRKELYMDSPEAGYGASFSIPAMDWAGVDVVWEEDSWNPIPITDEMRNAHKVVFREEVNTPLYNYFHRNGMESTLEHLFRLYHYEGLYEDVYNEYRIANLRSDDTGYGGLMRILKHHSLLRGKFYN